MPVMVQIHGRRVSDAAASDSWCAGEIVVGSDVPKNRLMRLAVLALGATPWALVIVIVGVPK